MNKEKRLVTLALLTLVIYSGSLYLQYRTILFPFPLNETVFFIASLAFFIWNHQKDPMNSYLSLSSAFLSLLSAQFFWSFFLTPEEMTSLIEHGITDWIRILFFLALLLWSTQQLRVLPTYQKIFMISTCWTIIPIGLYWTQGWILMIFAALVFAVLVKSKIETPFRWLWLLLSILEGCKIWMLSSAL